MSSNLYETDLNFIQEARKVFDTNFAQETHICNIRNLIALRRGPDRDCLQIFRLDGEVCFVHNIMEKAPAMLVQRPPEGDEF